MTQFSISTPRLLKVRAQDHGADKPVVADFVEETELQGQRFLCSGELSYLFGGVSLGCRVELIGFVEQLGDADEIGGSELPVYD